MPLVPGQTTKHLHKLRADPEMLAFLCGFDTPDGTWSHIKAHEALGKGSKGAAPRQSKSRPNPCTPGRSAASKSMSHIPTAPTPCASAPGQSSAPKSTPQLLSAPGPMPSEATSCDTNSAKHISKNKARESLPASRPAKKQCLSQSFEFRIASQGRISNMQHFRRTYKSFVNSGAGDCLFESFKQFLQLPDTVINMRRDVVTRLEHASEEIRVSQLNEHIMREIEARNEEYMGWGIHGGDGLDERQARETIISSRFSELWALYSRDMQHSAAYAGSAEIVALADMYGVNVTIWAHNEGNGTASHLMTHLQSPPAHRTVHLLNLSNVHYEATNLQDCEYPIIEAPRASVRPVRRVSQTALSDRD